jgi:Bacteriophage tail sheath protein
MPEYLSPGVYVKEIPSAVQPIAGVGTSTAGFVGIIPNSIAVPKASPHYDPTQDPDATIEIAPTIENLPGATLAQEITIKTEITVPAGTELNAEQAQAIKAAGGEVEVTYTQGGGEDEPLSGKVLAEDIRDSEGNLIHFVKDDEEIELVEGYQIQEGDVAPIRTALSQAGITEIAVRETVDMAVKEAEYLVGKTLVLDTAGVIEETLIAGTVVADEKIARGIVEAVNAVDPKKIKIKNSLFLSLVFSPVTAGEVKLCTNFAGFKKYFGDFSDDEDQKRLAHAVYGFFNNGGSRCYVMRFTDLSELQLAPFEAVDEIALVAAPGISDEAVQSKLLDHCTLMEDRFAILDSKETITGDPPPTKENIGPPDNNNYGAFYFPWIKVFDPATQLMNPESDGRIFIGPSGHLAGIYARVDTARGVHKAPANEVVRGALELKYPISKGIQDGLNPDGINCIRDLNGNIRVWGARTLGGDGNGEWKYINVRRLFLFLRESIDEGTQWVVFEPNTPELWAKIRRNITAFLTNVWRSGALFGTTPQEAFYVKCDEETNTPDVRDQGQVVTEIGVAVVKPAEFVIFRISQWAGPGS